MKSIFIILSFLFINLSFGQEQNFDEMVNSYYKKTVSLIYPHQVYKRMLKGEKIVLLDTREEKEFNVSFIQGAIHVGYNNFNMDNVSKVSKKSTVIVYCTIGARSENIGEKLQNAGYENVFNLYGGMTYWKNRGYSVFDSTKKKTEKIHVYSKEWGKWLTKGIAIY